MQYDVCQTLFTCQLLQINNETLYVFLHPYTLSNGHPFPNSSCSTYSSFIPPLTSFTPSFSPCYPSCASFSQPSHSPTLAPFPSLPLSEQEETVKTDIFAAYCTLLSSTQIVTSTSQQQKGGASEMVDTPLIFLPAQTPTILACRPQSAGEGQ